MGKKLLAVTLLLIGFVMVAPPAHAGLGFFKDLCEIVSPEHRQALDTHPVEVFVSFSPWANTSTFRAWLNGRDITGEFEPAEGGMRALVGPENGLNYRLTGTRPPGIKMNLLVTLVQGTLKKKDLDTRVFFVEYEPVKTTRDEVGVWFITGGSLYDVFDAMGYAVATDRLWQMETYRRSARGRLAEVFGSGQLGTDIFMRTIGYSNDELIAGFAALDKEARLAIQGYVDGINRRIGEIAADPAYPAQLPYEFLALGFFPEDWSVSDVLAWMSLLLRQFDCEALKDGQIKNAALLQYLNVIADNPLVAAGMFNDLRWMEDPEALTYITAAPAQATRGAAPAAIRAAPSAMALSAPGLGPIANLGNAATVMEERLNSVIENLKRINAWVKMGSYAWAISADKTADNNPIIYSGPQMGFSVPSIVLEGSIRGGGLEISGMSVPGIPGIVIGRTPHHAWSMQVGHAHTVDYYLEEPGNVALHRYETIHVAGASAVTIPVFRTSHGPLINPLPYDPGSYVPSPANPLVSWKYAHWGYEFDTIGAYLKIARAQSMDEFGEGIEDIAVSQHFCYADRDGNIAYWMSGRNPMREPLIPFSRDWRFPQGLFGISSEWDSEILIERSTDRNPPQGYYAGWNNKSSVGYPESFNNPSYTFGSFHRAHVIDDFLAVNDNLTYGEVRDLALNIATTRSLGGGGNPWAFVESYFIDAVDVDGAPQDHLDALALLASWDGHFVAGGPAQWATGTDTADAWILMDAWIDEVIRLTFDDELGGRGENRLRLFNVLLHGLAGSSSGIVNTYDWFTNLLDPSAPQTADDIIVAALDTVLADLGGQPWGENERGDITYRHDLFGPVWQTPYSERSTYAHCVEFGPWGPIAIESMFPLGESGTILIGAGGAPNFNADFFSMTPYYDNFIHREFPLFE
ncbi:MAG TPA: penicillin acylase family protein [Deltaproteobacteria bacterium]|nr:penicillin acylase family protein [Deltaproteobacteria bacterium]